MSWRTVTGSQGEGTVANHSATTTVLIATNDHARTRAESLPLMADAQLPREGGADRQVVDVAVGVLIRKDGDFLLTSRPAGKVYAGYWEFPGGKFETGETVQQALSRELHEELGIQTQHIEPWRQELVDYPHALVRLHFCKVLAWSGELQMREAQSFAWQRLPVTVAPVLPGTVPVLTWLAAERGFSGVTF